MAIISNLLTVYSVIIVLHLCLYRICTQWKMFLFSYSDIHVEIFLEVQLWSISLSLKNTSNIENNLKCLSNEAIVAFRFCLFWEHCFRMFNYKIRTTFSTPCLSVWLRHLLNCLHSFCLQIIHPTCFTLIQKCIFSTQLNCPFSMKRNWRNTAAVLHLYYHNYFLLWQLNGRGLDKVFLFHKHTGAHMLTRLILQSCKQVYEAVCRHTGCELC